MSSLPFAYSIEYGETVSAYDAYDLYWEDKISDQHKFLCIGENCKASVTLANMYKEEFELRQAPHFRCKDHSSDCEYVRALLASGKATYSAGSTPAGKRQDIFISKRPEKTVGNKLVNIQSVVNVREHEGKSKYHSYTAQPKFYSIRPVVDRYFVHREEQTAENTPLTVDGKKYTYRSFFKGVMNQNVTKLIGQVYIYWGIVEIRRIEKKNAYRIVFENNMHCEEEALHPGIIINDEALERFPQKKRISKYLNMESSSSNMKYLCFVYSSPSVNETPAQTYINFKISSLDFLDFKETSYLKKLKRKDLF